MIQLVSISYAVPIKNLDETYGGLPWSSAHLHSKIVVITPRSQFGLGVEEVGLRRSESRLSTKMDRSCRIFLHDLAYFE